MSSNVNINLVHALLAKKENLKNDLKSLKEMFTNETDVSKKQKYKSQAFAIRDAYYALEKDIIDYIKLCDSICSISSQEERNKVKKEVVSVEDFLIHKYEIKPEEVQKKKEVREDKESLGDKVRAIKKQAKEIKEKNKKTRIKVKKRVRNISDGIGGVTCKVISVILALLAINSIKCVIDNNKDAENAAVKVIGTAIYSSCSLSSCLGSTLLYKFGNMRLNRRKHHI